MPGLACCLHPAVAHWLSLSLLQERLAWWVSQGGCCSVTVSDPDTVRVTATHGQHCLSSLPLRMGEEPRGPEGSGGSMVLGAVKAKLLHRAKQYCLWVLALLYWWWPACLTPPLCYRLVFGMLYPAYASYKAVKTKNIREYVSMRGRETLVQVGQEKGGHLGGRGHKGIIHVNQK